jgi:hypothetical protein
MRGIAALPLAIVVALGGCALHEDKPSGLSWLDEQCPVTDLDAHPRCDLQVPRSALLVMPVEDRAREIWLEERKAMYVRPFAGDVIAVIATDQQSSFTFMPRETLRGTGLGEDALWRRALSNVDSVARTASITSYDNGLHWVDSDDVSGSMLVFSQRLWKRPEFRNFRGPPAIGLGDRNHFYVADSGDARAVATLRANMAGNCKHRSNYPSVCSRAGHLFVRTEDGNWSVLPE